MSTNNQDASDQGKIDNFHLPPSSSVLVMSQRLRNEDNTRKDIFSVTNTGNVNIEVDVLHSSRMLFFESPHRRTVGPNESHSFELNDHYNMTVLKVTNYEDSEAVFSAEGGDVLPDLEKNVEKLYSHKEPETKLENFVLPSSSSVLAMIQCDVDGSKPKEYTVTNHGVVDIFVKVVELTRHYDIDANEQVIKPNETTVIPVDQNRRKNGLRITNRSDTDEAVFTAEGGQVVYDVRDTIEKLEDLEDSEKAPEKIDRFLLPPRTYVTALSQSIEGDSEKPEILTVTNNGNVTFDVEIIHPKEEDVEPEDANVHRQSVLPNDTVLYELTEHFQFTILKVINTSYKEMAIFTAVGGNVVYGLKHMIKKIPDDDSNFDDHPQKIERARLERRSQVSVLLYDPASDKADEYKGFTVTNNGKAEIEVKVIHVDKENRNYDKDQVLQPNETTTFEHFKDHGKTILIILNKSFKELAVYSAEGGQVIYDFEHMVKKIHSDGEKVRIIKTFRLSPRTSVVVMTQSNKDETNESEIAGYSVTNTGHDVITVQVIRLKEEDNEEEVIRTELIKPDETKVIELGDNIQQSSLKIVNNSYKELAIFSAQGGDVIHGFENLIRKLPEVDNKADPIPKPLTDPTPEVAVCPVPEQLTDAIQEVAVCLVPKPLTDPTPEVAVCPEPITDPTPEVAVCPEPLTNPTPKIAVCPVPEPLTDPTPKVAVCPVAEPLTDPTPKVAVCPVAEPLTDPTPEVAVCPVPEPLTDPTPKVAICPVAEPLTDPTPEVAVCPVPEPLTDPTPKVAICPVAEPLTDPTPEVAVCPVPESLTDPTPKVAVCPVAEPLTDPTPEVAVCPVPEPLTDPTPDTAIVTNK